MAKQIEGVSERILSCARAEFLDKGYTDASLRVIAHRLKTVRRADQILVLSDGKIVQQGCHEDLIRQPGLCADFVGSKQQAAGWKL